MPRNTKCAYCLKVDSEEKVVYEKPKYKKQTAQEFRAGLPKLQIGVTKDRLHTWCEEKYLSYRNFQEEEQRQLDSLHRTLLSIYGSDIEIPPSFYSFIQELRNGKTSFGGRKYKEGISYETLRKTYEYCRDDILWAKNNKEFKNKKGEYSFLSELRYGLAIVRNNIVNMSKYEEKIATSTRQEVDTLKNYYLLENIQQELSKQHLTHDEDDDDDIFNIL